MRAKAPFLTLLLFAVMLAGCVDDPTPTPGADETERTWVTVDGEQYRLNEWLLGGPGPTTTTAVSAGAEPAIWVDRLNGDIWIGDSFGTYVSTDDGETFRSARPLQLNVAVIDGWDITQDDAGNLYAAGLAEGRLHVYKRLPGASAWMVYGTAPAAVGPLPDRPWIAAKDDGEVMLIYNDAPRGATHCAMSYDGGMTWPDRNPQAGGVIAGNIVADGDQFYWAEDDGTIRMRTPRIVAGIDTQQTCLTSGGAWDPPTRAGRNLMLQVAAEDGRAYVAYADTHGDIVIAGTEDFWDGNVVRVSPTTLKTNTFASVDIQDGRLVAAWYGSETDGDPAASSFAGSWNVYVAVVDDFWTADPTIQHFRLTDEPNHFGTICMSGISCSSSRQLLDYFEVDIGPDGDIHVAYAASNPLPTRSYYARIAQP